MQCLVLITLISFSRHCFFLFTGDLDEEDYLVEIDEEFKRLLFNKWMSSLKVSFSVNIGRAL